VNGPGLQLSPRDPHPASIDYTTSSSPIWTPFSHQLTHLYLRGPINHTITNTQPPSVRNASRNVVLERLPIRNILLHLLRAMYQGCIPTKAAKGIGASQSRKSPGRAGSLFPPPSLEYKSILEGRDGIGTRTTTEERHEGERKEEDFDRWQRFTIWGCGK